MSVFVSTLSYNAGLVSRSAVAQRSAAPLMGVEQLVGASEEISGKVWDPLELSKNMLGPEQHLNLVRRPGAAPGARRRAAARFEPLNTRF